MLRSEMILTVSLFFCFSLLKSQQLYDDFEVTPKVAYGFIEGILENNIANPNQSGINTSATCAKYTRNSSVPYDVILIEPNASMNDLSEYLSGSKKITMMVKTDVSVTVQITLENSITAQPNNYPSGRHSVYLSSTSGSGDWELLTFNFNQQPDAGVTNTDVDRMVILFDPGNFSNDIYYIDEIMGPEFDNPCANSEASNSIAENFDCQRNVSFDFSNGTFTVTDNPMKAGNNNSSKCGQFIKWTTVPDGAFGGTLINPFTTDDYISAKIDLYDQNAPQKFLISMQESNGIELSIDSITTVISNDWKTYSLDFSNISPSETIEKFVFLLNPSTETEDTIYIDNFIFSNTLSSFNEIKDAKNTLSLYPNPMQHSNNLIVDLKTVGYIKKIEITSIDGRLLQTISTNQKKFILNMSNYAKGNYIAKVVLSDNTIISNRIIK